MKKSLQRLRKMTPETRMKNARKWLAAKPHQDLLSQYRRHYRVTEAVAYVELLQLGYEDQLRIQELEQDGIAWEYTVDPCSGDMVVVPSEYEDL